MIAAEFLQSLAKAKSAAQSPLLKISGSYILERYDENLEHWLDSLGVDAAEYGPLFRETKIKVMVQEPSKFNKKWSLIHKEEGDTDLDNAVTYMFEPGKPFTHEGGGLAQRILCRNDVPNVIECQAEVKEKTWSLESKILFTPSGLTLTVVNRESKAAMTAVYARMADPWTLKKKRMLKLVNVT